jgi:CRISPR-associated protein Csm1
MSNTHSQTSQLNARCHSAIQVYEQALLIFAQRAGEKEAPISSTEDVDVIIQAEKLALANKTSTAETTLRPMRSIMGRLFEQTGIGYYRPEKMSSTNAIPSKTAPNELFADYQKLWNQFQEERQRQVTSDQPIEVQEAALLALMQRFLWAVPAESADDVSLYDFARMTAALTVCLQDEDSTDEKVALLVGADLSGVQEWLYTLSSSGAARSLRGRSVYLQLLMEAIAFDLLAFLGLPAANLLYVGGGNFYVLAPVSALASIEKYRAICGQRLLDMHGGALYVAMAATPLSKAQLQGEDGKIGDAWEQIHEQIAVRKGQRFAELSNTAMAKAIGNPFKDPGKPEQMCRVCQRVIGEGEKCTDLDGTTNIGQERKCELCGSLEVLGGKLSSANYLVFTRVETQEAIDVDIANWEKGLKRFGFDVGVVSEKQELLKLRSTHLLRRIYWWDEAYSTLPTLDSMSHTVWSYRPLAQCVPLKDEKTATFEEILKESEGIQRWGVLRMDVDNLGRIFQQGLPNSLCHVVGLSGMMRHFFEGQVPKLAQEVNQDGEADLPRIHLMYAGGDDLFVVGAWSYLPDLAWQIRTAFGDFACHNPHLTISGGISIALDANYPLYQAAREAAEAEDKAKDYRHYVAGQSSEKNALNFLGQTMSWAESRADAPRYDSYTWVAERTKKLRGWISGDDAVLPRSFLMNLRAIDAEWQAWKQQERGEMQKYGKTPRYNHGPNSEDSLYLGPWQWHLVYSLGRTAQRNQNIAEVLNTFKQHIVSGEIRTLGLSSRWTELLTREEGE